MQVKRLIALTVLLCLLAPCLCAQACVARPCVTRVTDAYGGGVEVVGHGDEFFNYLTDTAGHLLCYDAYGDLRYVVRGGDGYALGDGAGAISPQANGVGGADGQTERVAQGEADMKAKLNELRASLADGVETYSVAPQGAGGYIAIPDNYDGNADSDNPLKDKWNADPLNVNAPPKGASCPLLVLKVQFSNMECKFDDAAWHQRIFNDGVSAYYTAVSGGAFSYAPAQETYGAADGVITVTLPFERPGYDSGSGGTQNVSIGAHAGIYTGDDGKKYALYNDASLYAYGMLAANDYINFAQFDRNRDGYVSPTELAVLVVAAGYEAATVFKPDGEPMSWAHSWNANNYYYTSNHVSRGGDISLQLDGVKLYKYTLLGENINGDYDYFATSQTQAPVQATYGTACHELGHDLGLMDLYDTTHSAQEHEVGALSLMSTGGWGAAPGKELGSSPTFLDPYSKIYLGFYDSQTISRAGAYPVTAASNSREYNILRVETDDPDVYYLVENRTQTGYDRGLYREFGEGDMSEGVVYWRINERVVRAKWNSNTINNQPGNYGIMPEFLPGRDWPFRNATTYPMQPTILVKPSARTVMYCYDAVASRVNVWLGAQRPVVVPTTGDTATPALWAAIGAMCLAAIACLLWVRRKKK